MHVEKTRMILDRPCGRAASLICTAFMFVLQYTHPSEWWSQMTPSLSDAQKNAAIAIIQPGLIRAPAQGWYGLWYMDYAKEQSWQAAVENAIEAARVKRIFYIDQSGPADFLAFISPSNDLLYTGWGMQHYKGEAGRLVWFGVQLFSRDTDIHIHGKRLPTAKNFGLRRFSRPDGSSGAQTPMNYHITNGLLQYGGGYGFIPNTVFYGDICASTPGGKLRIDFSANNSIPDGTAQKLRLSETTFRLKKQLMNQSDIAGFSGWVTSVRYRIDHANTQFLAYSCAEAKHSIEVNRPDGIHFDDYGGNGVQHSFGPWMIAAFKDYARTRFSREELAKIGIPSIDTFDPAQYFHSRPFRKGSNDLQTYYDDERWLSDPVYRLYQLADINAVRTYFRTLYRSVKEDARTLLGHDIPVSGNLIPTFQFSELFRGSIDIPDFEWKMYDSYGYYDAPAGYYPNGRIGWVTRLASRSSVVGHSTIHSYVEKKYVGPNSTALHKVMFFDCLANRAVLNFGHWFLDAHSPGTSSSAGYCNRFLTHVSPIISGRSYSADIALVSSGWSKHAAAPFGGIRPGASSKRYLEEYIGWGEYLSRSSRQWDVVVDDGVLDDISRYKVVILPSVLTLDETHVKRLEAFTAAGGYCIITGEAGRYYGPAGLLLPRSDDVLAPLRSNPRVRIIADKPGVGYRYDKRAQTLDAIIDDAKIVPALRTDAPDSVSLSLSERSNELTIDCVNYAIDIAADRIAPTASFSATLCHPFVRNRTGVWMLMPAESGIVTNVLAAEIKNDTMTITIPGFSEYALVIIR